MMVSASSPSAQGSALSLEQPAPHHCAGVWTTSGSVNASCSRAQPSSAAGPARRNPGLVAKLKGCSKRVGPAGLQSRAPFSPAAAAVALPQQTPVASSQPAVSLKGRRQAPLAGVVASISNADVVKSLAEEVGSHGAVGSDAGVWVHPRLAVRPTSLSAERERVDLDRSGAPCARMRNTVCGSPDPCHQMCSPAFGSIYYPFRGPMLNPGPGHYEIVPDTPKGQYGGNETTERLANMEQWFGGGTDLGPGTYHCHAACAIVEAHSPQFIFSKVGTRRIDGDLPFVCHASPRFANQDPRVQCQEPLVDDAMEQRLVVISPRSASASHFDRGSRQPRPNYDSATWRLGGQVADPTACEVVPAPPHGCTVEPGYSEKWGARRRARLKGAKNNLAPAGIDFGRSRRF